MMLLPTRLPRRIVSLGCKCPGFRPLLHRVRAGSIAIVMYHGVTPKRLPVFNWCQLHLPDFEQQIEFLARQYTILPLSEVIDRMTRRAPLPRNPVALTFDDGFRNVLTTAYPVLKRHQAPATVFPVTGFIGTRQPAWPERLYHAVATTAQQEVALGNRALVLTSSIERAAAYRALAARLKTLPNDQKDAELAKLHEQLEVSAEVPSDSPLATLDWPEIAQLERTGLIEFGSHTHSHPILARCAPEAQYDELLRSHDILREHLGRCDLLAYPNGSRADFTADTQRFAAEVGYSAALGTEPGLNRHRSGDLYALRRINVGADTTLHDFEIQMAGL
jgi:peptidoglycan/xylan/chitin deacetylase (PgdA/CDA1 family)